MSSGAQFSITQYGQDRLVMDWFKLQDPFDQYVPIKITNNWSGGLYFVYNLVNPPAWYSNFSGSLSGNLAGAVPLNAGSSDEYQVRWSVSVSGNIDKSGPNTDSLTLLITAYTSGFLSGALASGQLPLTNVLYNRYSGVIKVFGDPYSNDVPTPTATLNSGGTLPNSGASQGNETFNYALSYMLSGWECDIGTPASVSTLSGFGTVALSWTGVAGVTQYLVYRWSGSTDITIQSSFSGSIDLLGIVSGLTFTDNGGVSALQSGLFRHRTWANGTTLAAANAGTFFSPPQARQQTATTTAHFYQLGKNFSGVLLLGPWYVTMHLRHTATQTLALQQAVNAQNNTSGTVLIDSTASSRAQASVWNRWGFYISGCASGTWATSSGSSYVQWWGYGSINVGNLDDIYIVAVS